AAAPAAGELVDALRIVGQHRRDRVHVEGVERSQQLVDGLLRRACGGGGHVSLLSGNFGHERRYTAPRFGTEGASRCALEGTTFLVASPPVSAWCPRSSHGTSPVS